MFVSGGYYKTILREKRIKKKTKEKLKQNHILLLFLDPTNDIKFATNYVSYFLHPEILRKIILNTKEILFFDLKNVFFLMFYIKRKIKNKN